MLNQYIIEKPTGFLKKNGKSTVLLKKAYIMPTKKEANKLIDKYGGELKEVYITLKQPVPVAAIPDCVYMVKFICKVNGLKVYGPYFTMIEAETIFDSLMNKTVSTIEEYQSLFRFGPVSYWTNNEVRHTSNKLGDELILSRVYRAKI